jgi:uncharacterized protein YegP (UPF0339 family)
MQTELVQSKFVKMPSLSNIDCSLLYDFSLTSNSKKSGFEPLEIGKNTHRFLYKDADGKALIFSRKFDTVSKRDKRIRQLIAVSKKTERFELIEENNSHYFILKACDQAKIARSKQFTNRASAEAAITYAKEIIPQFAEQYPQPVKRKKRSNVYNFDVVAESTE